MESLKKEGEAIKGHLLKIGDPAWSANWAVRMGKVALHNGDETEARSWLETAATLDPKNVSLSKLDRRLNDPCCNKLAAQLSLARITGTRYGGTTYVFATLKNFSPVAFKKI